MASKKTATRTLVPHGATHLRLTTQPLVLTKD